jgi:acetyltransferase-like isoleucine patch superfamily enzyme
MSLGAGSRIREHSWITAIPEYAGVRFAPRLEIGKDVYVGGYICITYTGHMYIGDGTVISEHVYIADSAHGIEPDAGPIMQQPLVVRSVRIGARSFIGYGARILPGVELGEHCIVGANSVVTKSFDAFSMVAGAPAKIIKRYNPSSRQWEPVK